MDTLLTVLLAGLPFWGFLLWAAWWLSADALRERRRARAAARMAARYERKPDERARRGEASAA